MTSPNYYLGSIGVTVYKRLEDVPYKQDKSWGFFKGSYGTVFRATRRSTRSNIGPGDVFAIKEIQALSAKDQQNVAQEIKFLRQCRHENILELEEAFIIDIPGHRMLHTICLATKPWAPVSLHHFITDLTNSFGHSTTCPWFKPRELHPWPSIVRQCLSGLAYLHNQQPKPIRHKDIKPHNILLFFEAQGSEMPEVRPVIIDFGISKEHIDGATTANTGTYEYKAPEQIKKQKPTLASDVFSLGCCFILIEGVLTSWPGALNVYNAAMDTDTCQFANNTSLVNKVLDDLHAASALLDSPDLKYFSLRFRGLVRKMLETEPNNRPSAALALSITETLESDLTHLLEARIPVEVDQNEDQWKEAEVMEEQVMEKTKMLGAEHPHTLVSMARLASTYKNNGHWEEAEKLQVQVMETRKTQLGPDHPATLTSMINLASIYGNQGRWEEAKTLQVQVMETRKTKLGADHLNTLASMINLASTYRSQGQWKEAEELETQVMETYKTNLGANHPDTLTSMANLASTFWKQGRWEEAEKLEVQVMEARKSLLGADHPSTLTSMANLASTLWNQGRWEEAEKLEVQLMETRKTKLGAYHPDTLISMANLASTFWKQGRLEEAEKLEAQVMEARKSVLGAEHPSTLTSMNNLASTFWNQGRWEEAEKLQMQVVETDKRVLGADHPDTLTSMANLASTYMNQGRWEEAEKLEVQVMEARKTKLGVDHPSTLTSMANLAFTWRYQGRHIEALALAKECMLARQRILGPEHPETVSSRATVEDWS